MKHVLFSLLAISILFSACKKEKTADQQNDIFTPNTTDILLGEAQFTDGTGHETTGQAQFYKRENDQLLRIEDLKTDNGPLLKVYLTKDGTTADFIDLGLLKATSGNLSYEIDSNVDLAEYNHVLIWCERFSVLFGKAEVK